MYEAFSAFVLLHGAGLPSHNDGISLDVGITSMEGEVGITKHGPSPLFLSFRWFFTIQKSAEDSRENFSR